MKSRPPNPIGCAISLEDWALIRHLHRSEGPSQRAIARQLGIARDTVASALATDVPPKYERASSPSAMDEVEPRIRALLSAYPGMSATVLAVRVGWRGSISWFRERVRAIRPRRQLDSRRVPRGGTLPRGRCPRSLRRGDPCPLRRVSDAQVVGGLQLRSPTRTKPGHDRPPGHRRIPGQGSQRGAARPTRRTYD